MLWVRPHLIGHQGAKSSPNLAEQHAASFAPGNERGFRQLKCRQAVLSPGQRCSLVLAGRDEIGDLTPECLSIALEEEPFGSFIHHPLLAREAQSRIRLVAGFQHALAAEDLDALTIAVTGTEVAPILWTT